MHGSASPLQQRSVASARSARSLEAARRRRAGDAERLHGCGERSGTRYLNRGLVSFSALSDCSVDLAFSNAVLEHVDLDQFEPMLAELYRVLGRHGACSHTVDLKDHLGGALNNLRFSRVLWESRLFADSGFYTNRIRYGQMLDMFERAGFVVDVLQTRNFPALPTPRTKMSTHFRDRTEQDLLVETFDVVLRPR